MQRAAALPASRPCPHACCARHTTLAGKTKRFGDVAVFLRPFSGCIARRCPPLFRAPAQERFYFGDAVLPLFESGIPLLLQRLKQLPDASNITIAYPDEGAWKRFHYQFKDEGYPEVGAAAAALP